MKKDIPAWAMREAGAEDQLVVRDSHRRGTMQIKWPEPKALRAWAKSREWPTPWLGFEDAFIARMLAHEASFALALKESGIEIQIPKRDHTIPAERLRELDGLYEERSTTGRPTGWGILVEELREIRRAVEAGVVVTVEGAATLRTWQGFYEWAHGRYHALEDGYDHWIGDDES
ncbi:MAG TPA: hypothetical protein VLQ45_06495 [Thermoanaerobaculia bacterium]|nr:hypothetical protein [Thermoanaerobaculia bacterium]